MSEWNYGPSVFNGLLFSRVVSQHERSRLQIEGLFQSSSRFPAVGSPQLGYSLETGWLRSGDDMATVLRSEGWLAHLKCQTRPLGQGFLVESGLVASHANRASCQRPRQNRESPHRDRSQARHLLPLELPSPPPHSEIIPQAGKRANVVGGTVNALAEAGFWLLSCGCSRLYRHVDLLPVLRGWSELAWSWRFRVGVCTRSSCDRAGRSFRCHERRARREDGSKNPDSARSSVNRSPMGETEWLIASRCYRLGLGHNPSTISTSLGVWRISASPPAGRTLECTTSPLAERILPRLRSQR
jgi:hypothetical protein